MIIGLNQLPVGFRFMPTDEELVTHYLMNKALYRPVPAAQEIREIDAARFYSNHPKNLGMYLFVYICMYTNDIVYILRRVIRSDQIHELYVDRGNLVID